MMKGLKTPGLPTLEYRRKRSELFQVYKIMHYIDKFDKDKLFTLNRYRATRNHSQVEGHRWGVASMFIPDFIKLFSEQMIEVFQGAIMW